MWEVKKIDKIRQPHVMWAGIAKINEGGKNHEKKNVVSRCCSCMRVVGLLYEFLSEGNIRALRELPHHNQSKVHGHSTGSAAVA
jgi:hypothetical protein